MMIVLMNLIFSFDSILSALAVTKVFAVLATAILVSGVLMLVLADAVADFIERNRKYEVLGLFILLIVGVVLLGEGGHVAHLTLFGQKVEAMAKLAPEDPEHMPPVEPQEFLTPINFSEATAAMTPEEALAHLRPVIELAREKGVDSAGYLNRENGGYAVANTNGLFHYEPETKVTFSTTARKAEGRGSGWASTWATDLGELDLLSPGKRAIGKALDSVHAKERNAGRTTVVLESAAVRDLVSILSWSLGRRSFDEGRSFLNGLVEEGEDVIGKKLFGDSVNLFSDPLYAEAPCPVSSYGQARKAMKWIENGVLRNLTVPRFWAKKQGIDPVPWAGNLIMAGDETSTEDLIAGVKNGVLITRLWYLRMVQPQTLLYTGLTRDGTFAIENGEIAGPVKNFRFNESPASLLNRIVASGKQKRVLGSEGTTPAHIPSLVVEDFNLSSVSDAS
ncbi:MAG: metallopeptidase TldD-related protein, partial [Verrucomicrobiota bacterium]